MADVALRDMLRWLDGEEVGDQEAGDDGDEVKTLIIMMIIKCTMHNPTSAVDSSRHSLISLGTASAQAGIQRDTNWVRDRIAIFDATNSTDKQRQWLLEECTSPAKRSNKPTGMVFIESICDDEELLEQNFHFKVWCCY